MGFAPRLSPLAPTPGPSRPPFRYDFLHACDPHYTANREALRQCAELAELAASGLEVDAVEALLPIPLHCDTVIEMLGSGWHVNLQKPICNDLAGAERMIEAAETSGKQLRVMENYLFYEPLRKLKETVESGDLGEVSGYHMKMVGTGRGGQLPAT